MKIKSFLLAAVMVLSISAVFAEAPVAPTPASSASAPAAVTPNPWECGPSLTGESKTASRPVFDATSQGLWAGWYCSNGVDWQPRLYWVGFDFFTPQFRSDLNALLLDPTDTNIASFKTKYRDPANTTAPDWVDQVRFNAAKPAAPVWVVASYGTLTNRPTYSVVNGVKSSRVAVPRASVGATCNCSELRIVQGTSTYCAVGTNLVSLCKMR